MSCRTLSAFGLLSIKHFIHLLGSLKSFNYLVRGATCEDLPLLGMGWLRACASGDALLRKGGASQGLCERCTDPENATETVTN